MSTSYADYVKQVKPPCWGREATYDPDDKECRGCRVEHSCRAKIQLEGQHGVFPRTTSIPVRHTDYDHRREDRDDLAAPVPYKGNFIDKANADIVPDGQSPVERILKDGATGALRGLFGEFYSFFRRYRIP